MKIGDRLPPVKSERAAERVRALEAVALMWTPPSPDYFCGDLDALARRVGARPLRPPPLPALAPPSVGELELRRERRRRGFVSGFR